MKAKSNNKVKNNKIVSRIDSYSPIQDIQSVSLTLDEVEREFPKQLSEKEIKEQEYTIERSEATGKLNRLIKYKFQYDLLVWQVFFEKCHEVENVFVIKDDLLDKAEKNNASVDDITIREIKYRRQNKEYADKLIDYYYKKKYDEYVQSMKGDDQEVEENVITKRPAFLITSLIMIVLGIANIFIPYKSFCSFEYLSFIISGFFGLLFVLFFIMYFTVKKVYKIKKYQAKIRPHMSYEEWLDKQLTNEEIQEKLVLIKKNYVLDLKAKEDKVVSYSLVLKNIKERMMELIPLYKDFYTEEKVNYLLNTVIDRKCDTIRKAVRLAKTKDYQVDYLSSTERLAKSFKFVEDYSLYIKEYNALATDKKIEFDRQIEINNLVLEYLNRISLSKITIDNDNYIK